jgi:hypothetical protein
VGDKQPGHVVAGQKNLIRPGTEALRKKWPYGHNQRWKCSGISLVAAGFSLRKLKLEQLADPVKIALGARQIPATYIVFDVLYHDDAQCLYLPLSQRKEILRDLIEESLELVESRYILAEGKSYYREVLAQGLEGVMAKGLDSPYLVGQRSRHWLKVKPRATAFKRLLEWRNSKTNGRRSGLLPGKDLLLENKIAQNKKNPPDKESNKSV